MIKTQKLLTTDELLHELENTTSDIFITSQKKKHKKKIQWLILWGIVAIAVLHLLLFSLPTLIGVHNTVQMIGKTRVIGIPYIAGDVDERTGHVIVISRYDTDQMSLYDRVIVYGLLDTDYYWEVEITDFNDETQFVSVSYDGFSSVELTYDDIDGVYIKDANFAGIFLFVSSRWTGLLSTAAVYGSLILVYYILAIREMKVVKIKEVHDEGQEAT